MYAMYVLYAKLSASFLRSSNTSKPRYVKSVKIGSLLVVVFMVSFIPTLYATFSETTISGYFRFSLFINNLANFFIYLVVDEEFRKKLKEILRFAN